MATQHTLNSIVPMDNCQNSDNTHERARNETELLSAWTATDAAQLLPSNLAVRHIPRAWERKAQSPLIKHRFSRKIWRRYELPTATATATSTSTASASHHEHDHHNAVASRHKPQRIKSGASGASAAALSPKKIVKKRCIFTSFGQSGRANHWDYKIGTPLRKKPAVFSSHLRAAPSPTADTTATEAEEETREGDGEWSDASSEHEDVDEDARNECHGPVEAGVATETLLPALSVERSPPLDSTTPTQEGQPALPVVHGVESTSECTEAHSPQRSSSAPPEGAAQDDGNARPRPRISDDTAILHAFLTKAAAKKTTPIHRRESLSNRRDSDVVRQALASPVKNEALADLDPNSPSPRKQQAFVDTIETKPSAEGLTDAESGENSFADQESGGQRPMRRSIRSRTQVSAFSALKLSPTRHSRTPKKITIGSATEQVPLKRTEAQELAQLTRTNTRKNKGGSVMPLVRIAKLASETASPEAPEEEDKEARSTDAKGVRWDTTLAYFQDGGVLSDPDSTPDVTEEQEAEVTSLPKPKTPVKRGARRAKTPVKPRTPALPAAIEDTAVSAVDAATAVTPAQQPEQPEAQPKRRRSRIATPAKGLLSAASLLPPDVVTAPAPAADLKASSGNNAPSVAASSAANKKTTKKPLLSSSRGLPTPRKLNLENLGASTAATTTAPRRDEDAPPLTTSTKKPTGIPTFKPTPSLAPPPAALHQTKPDLHPRSQQQQQQQHTRAHTLQQQDADPALPGLLSPAKKRPRGVGAKDGAIAAAAAAASGAGGGAKVLPGLASPAKRRGGVVAASTAGTGVRRALF